MTPDWNDPNDPAVLKAISYVCDQCHAAIGSYCANHISPAPMGRLVHFGRTGTR